MELLRRLRVRIRQAKDPEEKKDRMAGHTTTHLPEQASHGNNWVPTIKGNEISRSRWVRASEMAQ